MRLLLLAAGLGLALLLLTRLTAGPEEPAGGASDLAAPEGVASTDTTIPSGAPAASDAAAESPVASVQPAGGREAIPDDPGAGEFPMARVFGRVLDEDGRVATGLTVRLHGVGGWREGVEVPMFKDGHREYPAWSASPGIDGRFELTVPVPTSDWVSMTVAGDPYSGLVGRDFGHAGGRKQPPIVEGDNDLGDIAVPRTGALTGRVTDAAGAPIDDAIVTLSGQFPGGRSISARTDASGRYELAHLPPGPVKVQARCDGYLLEIQPGPEVRVSTTLAGPDFALEPAPSIEGIVVDAEGRGLAGLHLWGWPVGSGRGAGATTGDDGRFVLYLPQDEPYILEVDRDTRFVPWGGHGADGATFTPGTTDVRIALQLAERMRVCVVDAATGRPITRFSVGVRGEGANGGARLGDHDGGCVEVPAAPGKHRLLVSAPGYVPVEVEAALDGDAAEGLPGAQTVELATGASVVGRVTRGGEPVPAAQISFGPQPLPREPGVEIDPNDFMGETWRYDVEGEAARQRDLATGADGVFRVDGLVPGTYRLTAKGAGGSPRVIDGIEVGDGTETDLGDVGLKAEAVLEGELRLAPGLSPVGIEVEYGFSRSAETVVQSSDGRFTLRGIPPGDHVLTVKPDGHRVLEQVQRPFTIAEGETLGIVVDLAAEGPVDVAVRVTCSGEAVEGVEVLLVPMPASEQPQAGRIPLRLGTTDADGRVRGSAIIGRRLVAVASDGEFELGRSAPFVMGAAASEVNLPVSFGRLFVSLPEGVELPTKGVLTIALTAKDAAENSGPDPIRPVTARFATPLSETAGFGRPWTERRLAAGRVASGRYSVRVWTQTEDGNRQVPLVPPYSGDIEVTAGGDTEIVLR